MAYGVTQQMIEAYGEAVFRLSLNFQRRTGDPVRALDLEAVEAQRQDMGLSDHEIAARTGLLPEQARFIRVVMERRRFRTDQYRKLFVLGTGRRYREERYHDPARRHRYSEAAMSLREAMTFEPELVSEYVSRGWWTDETLGGWLAEAAERDPGRPAIRVGDATIDYGGLAARVARLAGAFAELGLGKGDVISLQLPNIPEIIVTYLAAARLGAVMSPIHMPYREAEIETLLDHSRARAVVCLGDRGEHPAAGSILALRESLPHLDHVIAVGEAPEGALSFAELEDGGGEAEIANPPVGADPLILLYTSGTTSGPKGVPLSHQNMLSNTRLAADAMGVTADDVMLSAAPISHLFGLYSVHLAICRGATNLLLPAFTPQHFAATVESGRGTFLFTAPAHGTALYGAGLFDQHDFSSVRFAIFAGAACGEELMRGIDAKLPNGRVGQLWGMTELQAGAFTLPDDPVEVPARTAGQAAPGNEVRVVSDDGEVLAPGEEGELQVRGCSIFPGYYDNDAANEAAFAESGWFRSGDLATLDEEGRVCLTGRIKDLINRGGVKYNPSDVEELLNALPDITQAAIVPMPDPQLGERACAFVVPAPGAEVTLEAICAHLTEKRVAKIKWPERLEIVDEMPITPTRKIIKGVLAARFK